MTVDGKLLPCTLCKAQFPLKEMRVHISFHLLQTPGFLQDKTCGFCGLKCTTVLVKNRNGNSTPQSTCKRFYTFKVAWAAKLSRRNLSTKIPILCLFCPDDQNNYVWKYCLAAHLKSQHNKIALPAEFQITKEEKAGLLGKQT